MFTIFHVLNLLGAFIGLLGGAIAGYLRTGWIGLFGGALAGLFVGLLCGKVPFWLIEWVIKRQVARISSVELWDSLRRGDCLMPNFALHALRQRGEDSTEVLQLTLEMLTSDDRERRLKGLAAFWSAFPELDERISAYNPDEADETRRESLRELQDDAKAGKLFK